MMKMKRFFLLVLLVTLLVPTMVSATVDVPDVQINGNPDFTVVNSSYGQFETEIMDMDKAVNNIIVAVNMAKAEKALVRCYTRFKYASNNRWTGYLAFDAEYHFSAIAPVSACQLMFIVRDPERGKTTINSFSVQGNYLEESKMQYFMQKPAPFETKASWAKPAVIARSAWGARPAKSAYTPHVVQRLIVHHSYLPNQASYKGAATIRGIQNYHMDDPKTSWADIGYHFLIGPDGVIYQGRPEGVVGAHCSPNTNSVGVCVIGNYDPNADQLNPAIEESLLNLLSWLASTYKVNPETSLFGHCDFATKSCPGAVIYQKLPQYKALILKNIGG
ncbi:MAG TPA: peptidoglycan recognition family protein [Candidatus Rifleibacterium sp.]|nr:peptidoglycan recognition family protein [Candidatus Rifleibacterium sp.]HPT45200.1 peptidoglycan recognition family protein [Candidatus Rifleibacterium sp.]